MSLWKQFKVPNSHFRACKVSVPIRPDYHRNLIELRAMNPDGKWNVSASSVGGRSKEIDWVLLEGMTILPSDTNEIGFAAESTSRISTAILPAWLSAFTRLSFSALQQ